MMNPILQIFSSFHCKPDMVTCYCSECESREWSTAKTVRNHLEKDEQLSSHSDIPDHLKAHLRTCIEKNRVSLSSARSRKTASQLEGS